MLLRSHHNFVDHGLHPFLLVGMPGLHCGSGLQGARSPYVFIAEVRAAKAVLESYTNLHLLDHRVHLGLAKGALVFGRDLGPDGQGGRGFALERTERLDDA